jgi:hypothetical protein
MYICPLYPLYFDMNEQNYDSICLNHRYQIVDLETVLDTFSKDLSDVSIIISHNIEFHLKLN